MIPIQKNLDWLWRLFFYTPPPVHMSIDPRIIGIVDASQTWPQPITLRSQDYATIAGTVNQSWTPPAGMHWLVHHWSIAGVFAATDNVIASFSKGTLSVRLRSAVPGAVSDCVGLVGASGGAAGLEGISGKIYLPPGCFLDVSHASAAGGLAFSHRIAYLEAPESQPFISLT